MIGPGPTQAIIDRMTDYFSRQIAWFGDVLAEWEDGSGEMTDEEVDSMVDTQSAREKETKEFEREFAVLKREWDQEESIAKADRDRIRALADEANALAEGLRERIEHAEGRVAEAMKSVKASLGTLRRGRGYAEKYKLGDTGGSMGIDRQA